MTQTPYETPGNSEGFLRAFCVPGSVHVTFDTRQILHRSFFPHVAHLGFGPIYRHRRQLSPVRLYRLRPVTSRHSRRLYCSVRSWSMLFSELSNFTVTFLYAAFHVRDFRRYLSNLTSTYFDYMPCQELLVSG